MFNVDRVIDVSADLPTWVRDTVVFAHCFVTIVFFAVNGIKGFLGNR